MSSRPPARVSTLQRPSTDATTGVAKRERATSTSSKADTEILSPKPRSSARANTVERLTAAVSPGSPGSRSGGGADAALARENTDLKSKIKILERKVEESRDKLGTIPKLEEDRDKYQAGLQKLEQKFPPMRQELAELRKELKEAKQSLADVEHAKEDQEFSLENAVVDREIAEEQLQHASDRNTELEAELDELRLEHDVLKTEHEELSTEMTPEERASRGWANMERERETMREAMIRIRDITKERETDMKEQIASLEEEVQEFGVTKEQLEQAKEKLAKAGDTIEDLQQQLETTLGADDIIEDLSHRNMSLGEEVGELKAVIEELELLKELNDELEINHVQNQKEMQEELDFKDSVIAEQARRVAQQDQALEDMEYTLSRFRQLVTSLQSDLEDIRASNTVTETESEQLSSRSRAMMDLNMKLQLSASKAQVKTIDLELRRLDAQEAEQHLEIVKLFLPDTYKAGQNSVLSLLRFRRVAFKANLLQSFIRERVNSQPHIGHEDDVFYGCDAIDKLTWVETMCDRFANAMGRCSLDEFTKYESAVHELDPVERALNAWIDGLRKDDLKEQKCADELHRTIAVLAHLGEVHLTEDLGSFADEAYMRTMTMQSHLESATVSFATLKAMVDRVVTVPEGEDDAVSAHFAKRAELAIGQTRSAKLLAGKTVRALEDLKTRSLSLQRETGEAFEEAEDAAKDLASLARQLGVNLHGLLTEEGRTEPYTFTEVQNTVATTTATVSSSSESDIFSTYLAGLRVLTNRVNDLAALCADLDQAQEFDVNPPPWVVRSQELTAQKTRPVDVEEELRRMKDEYGEARRTVAQRDEALSTAYLKVETLESRMKDAQAKVEHVGELEAQLEEARKQAVGIKEDVEKQDRELRVLEAERDKWKTIAGSTQAFADSGTDVKEGKERAVATAREMDALRREIESLQAAVRYLREDNRRARTTEQHKFSWLAEPLKKPPPVEQRRRAVVAAEGRDVLGELVRMAGSARVYDLKGLPEDKLAWRRAASTPQFHAAKQGEDYAAWRGWQGEVLDKSRTVRGRARHGGDPLARLQIRLPGADGKAVPGGRGVQIVGSAEWEGLQAARAAE